MTLPEAIDTLRKFAARHRGTYGTTCHAIGVVLAALEGQPAPPLVKRDTFCPIGDCLHSCPDPKTCGHACPALAPPYAKHDDEA